MKKMLLLFITCCSGASLFAGITNVFNATPENIVVQIKYAGETKIGCKPKTIRLKPGEIKKIRAACNALYIKFRLVKQKKWKKSKKTDWSFPTKNWAILQTKNGVLHAFISSSPQDGVHTQAKTFIKRYIRKSKKIVIGRESHPTLTREDILKYFRLPPNWP